MTDIPVRLNQMGTLPVACDDGTSCSYTRTNIHKGCILIIEGTNGKDAAWIDVNEAFGSRIYRHHILEA